ncbi:hypothetical protein GALL_278870 [mine drainage metagenome]|uniref:Uncharacterized protein n=1 Tax=mine drainage metagenome TaxID=410659 RepID=A0A1J5R2N9_9ZZZZ
MTADAAFTVDKYMPPNPHAPQSATELQAVVTLKAARDVARDIEDLRNRLKDDGIHPFQRQRLKDDLLEAAERLCNLLDLLMSWLTMVSASVRHPLSEGIQELRERLLSTGVRLIGDKADRLLTQADLASRGDGVFPLGISFRMAEAVANLLTTVEVLGGYEAMPEDVQEKLASAQDMVHHLRLMEENYAFAREFEEVDTPAEFDDPPSGFTLPRF